MGTGRPEGVNKPRGVEVGRSTVELPRTTSGGLRYLPRRGPLRLFTEVPRIRVLGSPHGPGPVPMNVRG